MAAKKGPSRPVDDGSIPAMAYLCGEERLLVDDAFEKLRQRALAEVGAPDFNHDRVSGRKETAQGIVNLCRTLPVMSKRRLVEVREAEGIPAADHDLLVDYANNPDPSSTLLLVGEKPDMRLKLFKKLEEAGVLHVFSKLSERELSSWVERRCKHHQIVLQAGAVDSLVAAIGAELMLLERALEKLRLVVGEGGVVTEDQVAEHVAVTRVETSFKIVDAMAQGNLADALQTMLSVVDAGEPPLRLLGALAWAQRQQIRFLDLILGGEPVFQAARTCRIFKDEDRAAARVKAVGREGLSAGLAAIAEADRSLKSSSVNDEEVLMELLLKLTRLARARQPSARGATGTPARPSAR